MEGPAARGAQETGVTTRVLKELETGTEMTKEEAVLSAPLTHSLNF